MQNQDTLRMPSMQLDSLLGRARGGDEPVFLLLRRRSPTSLSPTIAPGTRRPLLSSTVSIVLFVALILGALLLFLLPTPAE